MEIDGSHVLVAGATGAIGTALSAELASRGARLALAGRDPGRLARAARTHGAAATAVFDAYDPGSCASAVHRAAEELGGLDAVVTVFGTVAFGTAPSVGDEVAEHLLAVNALAPAAFLRAALGTLRDGGAIAAVTGVVAERPMPGMADYSASKAALGAWLDAVRRETRPRGVQVLDIRFGHLDTGFADRPVAGTAPPLPPGGDLGAAVRAVADALHSGADRVVTAPDGTYAPERHAR
ncbi:SDR family NAD(P)-dependent oxidoreductase [Streptomyces zhihengii]|uniref:SDR family NAD(P)-dependent oxidoreductase n=1 Tax=Streptomyces zhihengii TaxID=1818004 RepID=A0ABS2UIB0_9ACTN|nr:SDR family NAD(P)-dependent oxidoreductase [Streptomyces zhihengii]MBM9617346.1 SDR family NAD(P)-dependent oxidoreductase [Streptomyces zhihengii]